MKTTLEEREARTSVQEGISLLPYVPLYQRMHQRRWRAALLLGAAIGALALVLRRSARR